MKDEEDYIRNISEMRSLMERSSKFLSLSGLAAIMAGIYALAGAGIFYRFFYFNPADIIYNATLPESISTKLPKAILLATIILILAINTTIFLSYKKANLRREQFQTPVAKQVLLSMTVPLVAGGLLILILISKGLISLMAPLSLLFYGIALYNAGRFTYGEIKSLGLIQVALGVISSYFVEYGSLFWVTGFGIVNIIYGIYIHYKYER